MPSISQRSLRDIKRYAHREAELREFITTRLEQKRSVNDIRIALRDVGVDVCKKTIYNWCYKWQQEA